VQRYDAERDLKDIGAGKVEVYPLNKMKYAKISSPVNNNVKKGVIFSTYSALIGESSQSGGKYKSRLKQLVQWCGEDFDGCIVFDECHRAKNLCPTGSSKPTKTGLTVLEIQNRLPKARYAPFFVLCFIHSNLNILVKVDRETGQINRLL